MNGRLKISTGVDRSVLAPQMALIEVEAPKSFAKFGHDCVITSAYRENDEDSLHGWGFAEDFDSTEQVLQKTGKLIEEDLQLHLNKQYFCLWHKTKSGKWHLHTEFDPENKGVEPHRDRKRMEEMGVIT